LDAARHKPEYQSWEHMKQRCYSIKHKNYKNYGGRGVMICDRWKDFQNFLADMGPKPTPRHTIERIDTNGHYEPGNCRWATNGEQQRNRRDTVFVDYRNGKRKLVELCEELGLKREVVYGRIKMGWTVYDALHIPVRGERGACG